MVENIEYPLFSGPCQSIKNWYQNKCTFCYAKATLRYYEISNIMAHTKREINDYLNSLLQSKGLIKIRATGKKK